MPQFANAAALERTESLKESTESSSPADNGDSNTTHKKLLFLCYCLCAVDYGCLETMVASLFSDVSEQLGTSELQMSYIVLGRALSYIFSTFIAAFVIDKFRESHRYYGIILILGAVATVMIPFTSIYAVQMFLWGMTGFVHGTIDTALPVYAYRGWDEGGAIKYVTFLAIKGATNTFTPLIIQFSMSILGEYKYALFAIACNAIIAGTLALCLKTPRHDALRSNQAAMRWQGSERDPATVLQELAVHSKLKNAVAFLWCSLYIMHGLVQSGTLTHATIYCTEYLGIDAGIGRFLISMYCGGQLVFRILIAVAPSCIQKVISTTKFMIRYLSVMVVAVTCLTATWLFVPIQYKLPTLYAVFPVMGFVIGGIGPYAVRLVESITPINGTISCLFMMFCGAGDFLIVFANGELIQKYGAGIQPAAISMYSALVIPILALTIWCHRRYQRIQTRIVNYSTVSQLEMESPSAVIERKATPYHKVEEFSGTKTTTLELQLDAEGSNRSSISVHSVSSVHSEMDQFLEPERVEVAVISE